ncbi:MAG TPA: PilZ domain-containing protein [Vicinamibacteria bacterium]|nr:PilZ domain-containing protein [Vicinamibacteria bacterium]
MEKRSVPRVQPFIAPCLLIFGERRVGGYLTDLSPRGAQVSCDEEPPEAGSVITLEVRFTPPTPRCRVPAHVRWTKPAASGHQCGLTFEDLGEEDRAILEDVIARVRRLAAQLS